MKTFLRLSALMAVLLCGLGALMAAGCSDSEVAAAVKQSVQQSHVQAKVQTAKIADKSKVAEAKAEANPADHPLTWTEIILKKLRAPLIVVTLVSFVLLAITIGLLFTPLSAVSKIGVPVCGSVSALSLFGLIALPFFPWVLLGVVVAAIGLMVYEIIKYKSLPAAVGAAEKEIESVVEGKPATA